MRLSVCSAIAVAAMILAPAAAHAEPYSIPSVFTDAPIPIKVLMLSLAAATVAAIAVCLRKLAQGPRLSGGSAYLRGLRYGGPLAGLVGAALGGLNMVIGVANLGATPPLSALAHGIAEIVALVLLGLVSGAVAVIANWAVDARIDRTILGE
jgi:hypothetical protein